MDFLSAPHWNELVANTVAYWLFATVVGALPTPRQDERWYGWFYTVLQTIAANWANLKGAKMPPPQLPPANDK